MSNPSPSERLAPLENQLPAPSLGRGFTLRAAAILACVWILSLTYMGFYLKRGWVPHDEGTYAQSAERVLHGELPHRDFDEGYTGGLTFLNALAFRMLGVNLASLRILLFAVFALWVPSLYYVATRLVTPLTAGSVTLLCVAWSVPNHAAPSPSWYNLFFATFGIAALFRYTEVERPRWLFIAGLCAGLSILAKITGVYSVAVVLLFFVFREQTLTDARSTESTEKSALFKAFVWSGLSCFLLFLTRLVLQVPGPGNVVYYLLPSVALVGLLLSRELAEQHPPNLERFKTLFSMSVPFAAGVAAPILIFLIPFMLSHSMGILLYDVFGLSQKQLLYATSPSPSALVMLALLPIGLLIVGLVNKWPSPLVSKILLIGYMAALLAFSPNHSFAFSQVWCSMAFAIPAITVSGAASLGIPKLGARLTTLRQQQTMILIAAVALLSLVQFPFSAPLYFLYVAPFVTLAGAAVYVSIVQLPPFGFASLMGFYLLFAVFLLTPRFYVDSAHRTTLVEKQPLKLARAGGLRVDPADAELYDQLIPLIQSHALGEFIYAAPDCPEVYFLSGLRNPTRIFFDYRDVMRGGKQRILELIQSHGISVVAIDRDAQFYRTLEPELMAALEKLYPISQEMGHFQVRWRTNDPAGTD